MKGALTTQRVFTNGNTVCVLASENGSMYQVLVDDKGVLFTTHLTETPEKHFKNLTIGDFILTVDNRGALITENKN